VTELVSSEKENAIPATSNVNSMQYCKCATHRTHAVFHNSYPPINCLRKSNDIRVKSWSTNLKTKGVAMPLCITEPYQHLRLGVIPNESEVHLRHLSIRLGNIVRTITSNQVVFSFSAFISGWMVVSVCQLQLIGVTVELLPTAQNGGGGG
jgi:hypothetical protein